ncbi:hypothetical protein SAMN04488065_2840 [Haloplanus vescus]|uniref:DUF8135 domain-containing protein n=1 Tax=Haloplanus vescus TaxID=555874 RepID=A0A1H4AKE1_9EURY|nr:hypothetical protein [Haloplanus vescus]SEA36423.1 hypothetical protein SAMN04488065_2840 [Haloplanus vescus]
MADDEGSGADDPTDADDDPADDEPLGDLAREVRARRERQAASESVDTDAPPDADLFGSADADAPSDSDPFESVDVDHIDEDAVWEAFAEGDTGQEASIGLESPAETAPEADEHVVPKRDFCQRCPHFSAPPDTACTHEGTTIVEMVDTDHFRVRNCPIVEDEDATTPD